MSEPQRMETLFRLLKDGYCATVVTEEWWRDGDGLDWPAEKNAFFERAVGAVLVQNTSWKNVSKAISNLHKANLLLSKSLLAADESAIASCTRPAGFVQRKPKTLIALARLFASPGLVRMSPAELETRLLDIKGIGRETADTILLFVFGLPRFPLSSQARRVVERFSGVQLEEEDIQKVVRSFNSPADLKTFHALLVEFASTLCVKTQPKCRQCKLRDSCKAGRESSVCLEQ